MNLLEGIQKEQKRLREELIPLYETIGPAGIVGIAMMKASIDGGDRAIASGDVVEMLRACRDLQEHTG